MLKNLLLGAAVTGAATLGVSTEAGAALPHEMAYYGHFSCNSNRTISETAPNMTSVSGNMEKVFFTTKLYRWNGATWPLFFSGVGQGPSNGSNAFWGPVPNALGMTWMSSFADASGVEGFSLINSGYGTRTWDNPLGTWSVQELQPFTLSAVPPGYYKVVQEFEWANGQYTSAGLKTATGSVYCQIS